MRANRRRARRRRGSGRALRRSEESFRLLVDSVVDYAIFMLDPDGIVSTWNAGAQRLKGYREDEIVGNHYSVFYPPEYRAQDLPAKLLATAMAEGRAKHSGWRVRKDGTRFWADVVITALFDENDVHTGFAKVTRDMTDAHEAAVARDRALKDQQRALENLEATQAWRREFTNAVVHDLQSPVTAILGFAGLLTDDAAEDERVEIAERIRSNARALQHLIANLRADASLSEGYVRLVRESVVLREFVSELLADMAPVVADREVEVDVGDVRAVADVHALDRMLRNLVSNAVEHTASGARIRVGARRADDGVEIVVEDEGTGIPEEVLPQIFERFTTGTRVGMGLGLSVVRQYVELHGGTVDVTSEPGRGTRLWFTLPDERVD